MEFLDISWFRIVIRSVRRGLIKDLTLLLKFNEYFNGVSRVNEIWNILIYLVIGGNCIIFYVSIIHL